MPSRDVLTLLPTKQKAAFADDVVVYIAGFVVRKLKNVQCEMCFDRLFASETESTPNRSPFDLIELRDNGGLIKPSAAVIQICQRTEHVIRHMNEDDLGSRMLLERVRATILNDYEAPFPNDHEIGLDCHSLQLTKSVIDKYVKVRLFHKVASSNASTRGKKIRSKLTKTILFSHQ